MLWHNIWGHCHCGVVCIFASFFLVICCFNAYALEGCDICDPPLLSSHSASKQSEKEATCASGVSGTPSYTEARLNLHGLKHRCSWKASVSVVTLSLTTASSLNKSFAETNRAESFYENCIVLTANIIISC